MNVQRALRTLTFAALFGTIGVSAYGGPAPGDRAGGEDTRDEASEGALLAGPTLTVQPGWWAPVVVKGRLFNNEGEGTATVSVYDAAGALLARRSVRPTIASCNSHGACWPGGTFTTSFSVAEIGEAYHSVCAEIRVTAYDNVLGVAATPGDTFLPSCLN